MREPATEFELDAAVAEWINTLVAHRRVPQATYRLQLNHEFTFEAARDLVSYLHDLGVSDFYSSPILLARTGSMHGYDICDHSSLNPELGTREDFEAWSDALRQHGMGLLLDVVPNHMGIGEPCNRWWTDVLENGPASSYASYFDIEWSPVNPSLANKVLLPILEDQYGKVLESGKLRLTYADGSFFIAYYGRKLPVSPNSFAPILSYRLEKVRASLGHNDEHVLELESILTALTYLPTQIETAPERIAERNREKEVTKRRIAALYEASAEFREAIDTSVAAFNGQPGDPHSFDLLDALLSEQAYRPAFWRVATEEINFRRFFDINELAAIRVEQIEVFRDTHALVLELLSQGRVTGVRIDHPDGLWDPPGYFRELQESYARSQLLGQSRKAVAAQEIDPGELARAMTSWSHTNATIGEFAATHWPLYVVVEKILSEDEPLPTDWAVDGTTGYDFLNLVNGLLIDGSSQAEFDRIYRDFVGAGMSFPALVNSAKKMIMLVSLASEINALSHELQRIAEANRWYRDFTLNSLTFAVREVIASLAVYRTYISHLNQTPSERDQRYVEAAVRDAKRRNPRTPTSIFDFVRDTLLLRNIEDFPGAERARLLHFVMKFQQTTGPVMAKGVEDTAFYAFNRLVSLNEVGGHPDHFGVTVAAFHRGNQERQRRWPHSMLASATHDTKRGEDTRMRINVLSEIPEAWERALTRWSALNTQKKRTVDGEAAPDRNDEYLIYQTLLGTWPGASRSNEAFSSYRDRVVAYVEKAIKEAKVHTSWVNPNDAYDAAMQDFVRRILDDTAENPFLDDLEPFAQRVAYFGRFNSITQTLVKLTVPGVPDIYQGTELWDLSLVDPDNRRPVDFGLRRAYLAEMREHLHRPQPALLAFVQELLGHAGDGRIKQFVVHRALLLRREHSELFARGSYQPLEVTGEKREHVAAFLRSDGDLSAAVIVPRLVAQLTGGAETPPLDESIWGNTSISGLRGGSYQNLLTGEELAIDSDTQLYVRDALCHFPVALLFHPAA